MSEWRYIVLAYEFTLQDNKVWTIWEFPMLDLLKDGLAMGMI